MTNPSANEKLFLDEIKGVFRDIVACLKTLSLYPPGHPSQTPALERAFKSLNNLLKERGVLSFGISDEELILFGEEDTEHRFDTSLAAKLHQFGILTINIAPELTPREASTFMQLLSQPQESTGPEKTIETALQENDVENITLTLVDYRRIVEHNPMNTSEVCPSDMWAALIQKARKGDKETLEKMAGCLYDSNQLHELSLQVRTNYSSFALDEKTTNPAKILSEIHQQIYDNLSSEDQQEFSTNLASLALSDDAEAPDTSQDLALSFLNYPDDMLLKVMAGSLAQQGKIDSRITTTFNAILNNKERKESLHGKAVSHQAQDGQRLGFSPRVWEQVCTLLVSGSEDQFMSSEYHQVLDDLNTYNLEELKVTIGRDYLHEVQSVLQTEHLRKIRNEMIFELIAEEDQEELFDRHPLELAVLLAEHAQNRDMKGISVALKRIFDPQEPLPRSKKKKIEAILFQLDENSWVDLLIQDIGNIGNKELDFLIKILKYCRKGLPEALIRHLGEEGSISGRKRLSSLLVDLGKDSIPAIREALNDTRWYLVRNLVMILGKIRDDSCIEDLILLLSHDHFRVQREVLLTLSMIGGDLAVPNIRRILLNRSKKAEPPLQTAAALALKRIGTAKSRKVLQVGLEDKEKKVQEICCQVIKGLI